MIIVAYLCNDLNNNDNHCNIDGRNEDKFWKLHSNLSPIFFKKDANKKNLLDIDSSKLGREQCKCG